MTANSKAELLSWLSADGRLLGNDMVFSIDKAKADALLTQEYIRRFNTSSYLPPVNGETAADNGYKVHMQNFVLDHPRLSFDNVDITSSKASLRMKLVGGNQVDLKQAGAHWYPQRVDAIDPLVGPELSLKLELSEVPGTVDEEGRILLDLRNSDDFVLTFSDSNRVRQLGGDFFKELFRALPNEKRVWSLGSIEHGSDVLLRPERFSLRTQRNPSAVFAPQAGVDQPDVDGAVLGMVRMAGNDGAQVVIPGPDYRYLIPTDGAEYSATVLMDKQRTILSALIRNMPSSLFEDVDFKLEFKEGAVVATAVSGALVIGEMPFEYRFFGCGDVVVEMSAWIPAHSIPMKDVLVVSISGDNVTVGASCQFLKELHINKYLETPSGRYYNPRAIEGVWDLEFDLGFEAAWTVLDVQGGTLRLDTFLFAITNLFESTNLPVRREPLPPGVELGRPCNFVHALDVAFAPYYYFLSYVTNHVVPVARAALAKDLATDIYLSDVVGQTIQLNFGGALVPAEQHLPRDVACFGHVNPRLTTFTVTPLEPIITQGSSLQFTTLPAQSNLSWSVEPVENASDDAGKINGNGLYQAPQANGIQGAFTRVRITATHSASGYKASALIAVVKNALSLSPLVEVCQVGDTGVSLKAGHVGAGELQWRILGSSPQGRLAHAVGPSNTYIPGANVAGKAFLVEQVEVRNSLTNEQRTLCVITSMTAMRPSDVLVAEQDTARGRVWLTLSAGTGSGISELSVVHGPGQIGVDGDGKPYYQAESSSAEPFCVVRALWDVLPGIISFEGFIILPLPLSTHTAVYQTLGQAAQRIKRAH